MVAQVTSKRSIQSRTPLWSFVGNWGLFRQHFRGYSFAKFYRDWLIWHRFSVIRSLSQSSSDHVVGSHNVLTGWESETENSKSRYPDLASVISRKRTEEAAGGAVLGESTDPRLAMGLKKPAGTLRLVRPTYNCLDMLTSVAGSIGVDPRFWDQSMLRLPLLVIRRRPIFWSRISR